MKSETGSAIKKLRKKLRQVEILERQSLERDLTEVEKLKV